MAGIALPCTLQWLTILKEIEIWKDIIGMHFESGYAQKSPHEGYGKWTYISLAYPSSMP